MPQQKLRMVVGIPSKGRKAILSDTVVDIARQHRLPDEVVLCLTSESDVDREHIAGLPFPVRILFSTPGSCRQRNHILENAPVADVIVFLDDDFLMAPDYLHEAEKLFAENRDIVICTGKVLADGILGPGISVKQGKAILAERLASIPREEEACRPVYNGYGCNMAVRMNEVRLGHLRFDENLPLYGWLEDVDFSRMAARYGRIVSARHLLGVHLGIKIARSPGIRLGYSQVANPVYLMGKKTMSFKHAASQIGRNFAANLYHFWRPEPWVDRKGRLVGNLSALADLMTGRLTPKKAEQM